MNTLDFQLGNATSSSFLESFAQAAGANIETIAIGKRLIELALLDSALSRCRPSIVAAAALSVAGAVTGALKWDSYLETLSGYKVSDIVLISKWLLEFFHQVTSIKQLAARTTLTKA